jgi:Domain of unknown function (DUF1707)
MTSRMNSRSEEQAMDDRIRVSDADRDRVTARLRDHFGQGRLTREELDERISAALNAKTVGDLRHVMADLPEPTPAVPQHPYWGGPQWAGQRWGGPQRSGPPPWVARRRHGPRFLPLVLLALLTVLLIHGGGWLLFGVFQVMLLFWVAMLVGGILFGVFHRRAHRYR